MSSSSKKTLRRIARSAAAARVRVSPHRSAAVLILGHMRSGSSLLLHLLASHPDVLAMGERNRPYTTPADLDALVADARFHARSLVRPYRYAVDQINHARFLPVFDVEGDRSHVPPILLNDRVRPILLLREPAGALRSMISVLGRHYGTTAEEALRHYIDRLEDLGGYAEALGGHGGLDNPGAALTKDPRPPALWLTYDAIVSHTDASLGALERYLALRVLGPTYRVRSFTGRRGDPSSNISAGRILNHDERSRHDVRLDHDVLQRAEAAYRETIDLLQATLPGIGDMGDQPGEPMTSER